jgi:hypothetical protein
MFKDYYATENFRDFQLQQVNTSNMYGGVPKNAQNRLLKTGKAELQCMQYYTLHSTTTEDTPKPVVLKDVILCIPWKICHFEFSPYFMYISGVL